MNELAVVEHQGSTFTEPVMPRSRGKDMGLSTRAGRKGDDFVFEPRESTFFFTMNVSINSRPIQIAFEKTFERCQLALFETEIIVPLIARNDAAVLEVNKQLDKKLEAFDEYMNQELSRANKLLLDNAKSLNSGDYTRPQSIAIRIYTPRSKTFVQLLSLADEVITAYGRLWIDGFMNEINFKRSVFAVRMRVIYLARDIWEMHTRSYIALTKARRQAEMERAAIADEKERLRLDARIEKANAIIEAVDERGGMENSTPDFGGTELGAESPHLMAEEDRGRKRARKTAPVTEESSLPADTHDEEVNASADTAESNAA